MNKRVPPVRKGLMCSNTREGLEQRGQWMEELQREHTKDGRHLRHRAHRTLLICAG
ncbi:hypothetical protein ACFQY3_08000 [Paenibacillus farraposensis]|uniref:hypothetical protein n=1 Tax=Paenibacillus farraposensis TaxID=2807095 RepID=UPI0036163C06